MSPSGITATASDAELINDLQKLLNEISVKFKAVKGNYPDGDLRPAFYGMTGNIVYPMQLHLLAMQYTLTQPSWWISTFKKDKMSDLDLKAVEECSSIFKHSYFVFFLARLETLLQKTIHLL